MSDHFSRVGSGHGDPTGPDPTRDIGKTSWSDPVRPVRFRTPPDSNRLDPRLFLLLLTRPAGRVAGRENTWKFKPGVKICGCTKYGMISSRF